MDALTRRKFLVVSGAAGGAAAATGLGLAELLRRRQSADGSAKKLVIITLYGGNDGLNTVIPYADPAYHSARPSLAYAPGEVLHLSSSIGLNRAMTGMKKLFDDKRLAIVQGVGYPKPDRSHFRSMDIWQTGSPASPVSTGWLGRWLDLVNGPAETAVSFEPVLPPLLAGATHAGVCVSPGGLALPAGMTEALVASRGRPVSGEPELQARAAGAFRDLLRVDHLVGSVSADSPAASPSTATGTGGQSVLGTQLDLIAKCIEAGVSTRVYSASLGGFDTHADERASQERLLKQLDGALTEFADRLNRSAAGRRVAVLVYSEFGRRVRANASQGTDHGTAGPVFLLGAAVKGGLYGEHPSLKDLDDGDLKSTVDFRALYAELLDRTLEADPAHLLPGYRPKYLDLLR